MPGRDFVIGNVTDVVDGGTLNIAVDRVGGKQGHELRGEENIRIHRFGLTDIAWMTGVFTRSQTEKMLKGKRILCLIRSREQSGMIIADVQLI